MIFCIIIHILLETEVERRVALDKNQSNKREIELLKNEIKKEAETNNYKPNSLQKIMVMIGKTGHGKSTLGNRIYGDKSKKGNEGPFEVYSGKDKCGTTKVQSFTYLQIEIS